MKVSGSTPCFSDSLWWMRREERTDDGGGRRGTRATSPRARGCPLTVFSSPMTIHCTPAAFSSRAIFAKGWLWRR